MTDQRRLISSEALPAIELYSTSTAVIGRSVDTRSEENETNFSNATSRVVKKHSSDRRPVTDEEVNNDAGNVTNSCNILFCLLVCNLNIRYQAWKKAKHFYNDIPHYVKTRIAYKTILLTFYIF